MKKIKFYGMLLVLTAVLTACPYSSEVPIDTPSVKIETKILDKWEPKSGNSESYTISKADEFTYNIEKKSKTSTDVTKYKGFLSDVNGTKFFNVYEDNSSTKAYYIYKFDLTPSGSKITLSPVTENIDEKFTSSDELKKFITKYMGLSFFFGKEDEVYIRAD